MYADSGAVRLYLVSKAPCCHAGVLLAAPTVHAEVWKPDRPEKKKLKIKLIIDVTLHFHAG